MKTTTAREILQCVRETGLSLPEVMLRREWELNETPRETVYEKLGTAYRIMREAVEDSLREPHRTMGGLIGGEAIRLRELREQSNRDMDNVLRKLLPSSMVPVFCERLQISPELKANSLKKEQRRALLRELKHFAVSITGSRPVAEAIVTSGGVKVGEVKPAGMESKKVSGLFFAGEILDVDAYTGGFNLQIAWSTGRAAGLAAAETEGEKEA